MKEIEKLIAKYKRKIKKTKNTDKKVELLEILTELVKARNCLREKEIL